MRQEWFMVEQDMGGRYRRSHGAWLDEAAARELATSLVGPVEVVRERASGAVIHRAVVATYHYGQEVTA